jgi:hypothetical protein
MLMIAGQADAARSEQAKRRLTDERIKGIEHSFEQHAASLGANPAARPYVELGTAPPTTDSAKPGRK